MKRICRSTWAKLVKIIWKILCHIYMNIISYWIIDHRRLRFRLNFGYFQHCNICYFSWITRMASRNFSTELILFITLQLLIRYGGAVDKYDINIAVFFNVDDIYREFIFNSAEKMFRARNTTLSHVYRHDVAVEIHFSKPNLTNVGASGLSGIIPIVMNITDTSQGIIFVNVTEDGLLYSTLLESCSIPSIGLLQSQTTLPITQVN